MFSVVRKRLSCTDRVKLLKQTVNFVFRGVKMGRNAEATARAVIDKDPPGDELRFGLIRTVEVDAHQTATFLCVLRRIDMETAGTRTVDQALA